MGVARGASTRCFGAGVPSAGTLCQLLALGLLVETRLELAAQTQSGGTARRVLANNDSASLVTAAQAETIVADHVEAAVAEMRGELDAASRLRGQLCLVRNDGIYVTRLRAGKFHHFGQGRAEAGDRPGGHAGANRAAQTAGERRVGR